MGRAAGHDDRRPRGAVARETAARRVWRRAAFVVTIWGANSPHRFAHSREQLHALGCDVVSSFPPLFWKYPDALLPYYLQDLPSKVLDARADVSRAFDLWEDDASRAEYVAQVRFRLMADFDGLAHPVDACAVLSRRSLRLAGR